MRLALSELKILKESNVDSIGYVNWNYSRKNFDKVEEILGYTFKNKLWLVEALTHKSYVD